MKLVLVITVLGAACGALVVPVLDQSKIVAKKSSAEQIRRHYEDQKRAAGLPAPSPATAVPLLNAQAGASTKSPPPGGATTKSPPPGGAGTKWVDENRRRRELALEAEINPIAMEARRLFEAGAYGPALAKYRESNARWKAAGGRGDPESVVECLYRLGRYQEAVDEAEQRGVWNSQVTTSVALALVRLHRTDEARRFLNLDAMKRPLAREAARDIRPPKDERTLLAYLHLARGMMLFFTGQYREAHPELKQAYALDPGNRAIASLGLDTSLVTHNEADQLLFAQGASRIPGVFGDKARALLQVEAWKKAHPSNAETGRHAP